MHKITLMAQWLYISFCMRKHSYIRPRLRCWLIKTHAISVIRKLICFPFGIGLYLFQKWNWIVNWFIQFFVTLIITENLGHKFGQDKSNWWSGKYFEQEASLLFCVASNYDILRSFSSSFALLYSHSFSYIFDSARFVWVSREYQVLPNDLSIFLWPQNETWVSSLQYIGSTMYFHGATS